MLKFAYFRIKIERKSHPTPLLQIKTVENTSKYTTKFIEFATNSSLKNVRKIWAKGRNVLPTQISKHLEEQRLNRRISSPSRLILSLLLALLRHWRSIKGALID